MLLYFVGLIFFIFSMNGIRMNKFMAMALCCGMFFGSASLDAMRKRSASESFEDGGVETIEDQDVILVGRVRTGLDMTCEVRTLIEAFTQDQSHENARPLMDVIKGYLGLDTISDQELLAMHMDNLPLVSEELYPDFVAEISMNSKEDLAAIFESSPEVLIMVVRVVIKYLVTYAPQDSVIQIMNVFTGGEDALLKFSAYQGLAAQSNQTIPVLEAHKSVCFSWALVELAQRSVVGAKAALVGINMAQLQQGRSFGYEEMEILAPYFAKMNEVAQSMTFDAMVDGLMFAGYMVSFTANPRTQPGAVAAVNNSDGGLSGLFGGLSLFGPR